MNHQTSRPSVEESSERVRCAAQAMRTYDDGLCEVAAVLFQELTKLGLFRGLSHLVWADEEKGWIRALPVHANKPDTSRPDSPWSNEDVVVIPRVGNSLRGNPVAGENHERWRAGERWCKQDDAGDRWGIVPFERGFVRMKDLQATDEEGVIVKRLLGALMEGLPDLPTAKVEVFVNFSFDDLLYLNSREMLAFIERITARELLACVRTANEEVKEHILSTIPSVMRALIEGELSLLHMDADQVDPLLEHVRWVMVDLVAIGRISWPLRERKETDSSNAPTVSELKNYLSEHPFSALKDEDRASVVAQLSALVKNGNVLLLEDIADAVDDHWFEYGISLVAECVHPHLLQDLLQTRLMFLMKEWKTRGQMIVEAMMSISSNDNPRFVELKMQSFFLFTGKEEFKYRAVSVDSLLAKLAETPYSKRYLAGISEVVYDLAFIFQVHGIQSWLSLVPHFDDAFAAFALRATIDCVQGNGEYDGLDDILERQHKLVDVLEGELELMEGQLQTAYKKTISDILAIQAGIDPEEMAQMMQQRQGTEQKLQETQAELIAELEKELQTARDMQMSLMPAHSPQIPGLDVVGRCLPATHVGGDFFQYFAIDENRFAISMADVTGHAMQAAIPVVMFSGILDSEIRHMNDLGAFFTTLNQILHSRLDSRTFVCFAMGEVDLSTYTLRLSNGGCPPPCHFRASSRDVVELEINAYPLGVRADYQYPVKTIQLEPGDRIVFCSDGIVEAENESGDLFGFERVAEAIEDGCKQTLSATQLMDFLLFTVQSFAGNTPQTDDQTVVVLAVNA